MHRELFKGSYDTRVGPSECAVGAYDQGASRTGECDRTGRGQAGVCFGRYDDQDVGCEDRKMSEGVCWTYERIGLYEI